MINLFFDCEMTKLAMQHDPESAELISIGCISEFGQHKFYAENADVLARPEEFNHFVFEIVMPHLEGGYVEMPYQELALRLKAFIEGFNDEVNLWTDSPYFDWPNIVQLFGMFGWPKNLNRQPGDLRFPYLVQVEAFEAALEEAFKNLRRHHALDDAIANLEGYRKAISVLQN